MPIDQDDVRQIENALAVSTRIDHERVQVVAREDRIVLHGAVATPEEAAAAAIIAERYGHDVVNELRIDRHLQEGAERPQAREQAVPAENEVLIGDTDMLAGPDAHITTDMATAFQENEPWIPPDAPIAVAAPASEAAGARSPGDGGDVDEIVDDPDPDAVDRSRYAAADLTQADLEAAARGATVPSLDPEAVADPDRVAPDPVGVDSLGIAPDDEALEPMVEQVPGTPPGPGATGEGTAGGGSISGVAATETGALGADSAAADPVRQTGGTMTDSGTDRGPDAREDPPLRADFPESG